MPPLDNLQAFQDLNDSWTKMFMSLPPEPLPAPIGGQEQPVAMMAPPVDGVMPTALSSLAASEAVPGSLGVVTFETIQGVLNSVETSPLLQASLQPESLKYPRLGVLHSPGHSHVCACSLTRSLAKQVKADAALGVSWLASRHFPNLAASFSTLMQTGNLMSSLDIRNLPLVSSLPRRLAKISRHGIH
jgi:hypothetical protein